MLGSVWTSCRSATPRPFFFCYIAWLWCVCVVNVQWFDVVVDWITFREIGRSHIMAPLGLNGFGRLECHHDAIRVSTVWIAHTLPNSIHTTFVCGVWYIRANIDRNDLRSPIWVITRFENNGWWCRATSGRAELYTYTLAAWLGKTAPKESTSERAWTPPSHNARSDASS